MDTLPKSGCCANTDLMEAARPPDYEFQEEACIYIEQTWESIQEALKTHIVCKRCNPPERGSCDGCEIEQQVMLDHIIHLVRQYIE